MSRFKSKSDVAAQQPNGVPGLSRKGTGFAMSYPTIWEYLSIDCFDDGKARLTSTLSFFCGAGGLQAALNDRETGLVFFVTGDDVGDILETMEDQLVGDNADWKKSKASRR